MASLAAGQQAGASKESSIFSFKIIADAGSGSYATFVSGIGAMVNFTSANPGRVPGVATFSLGSSGHNSDSSRHMRALLQAGVLPFVAAGNDAANACDQWPASSAFAVTVGASRSDSPQYMDDVAPFSDLGPCVDVFAPGMSILGACNDGNSGGCTGTWQVLSGTSMATPIAAGAASTFLGHSPEIDLMALKHLVASEGLSHHRPHLCVSL